MHPSSAWSKQTYANIDSVRSSIAMKWPFRCLSVPKIDWPKDQRTYAWIRVNCQRPCCHVASASASAIDIALRLWRRICLIFRLQSLLIAIVNKSRSLMCMSLSLALSFNIWSTFWIIAVIFINSYPFDMTKCITKSRLGIANEKLFYFNSNLSISHYQYCRCRVNIGCQ